MSATQPGEVVRYHFRHAIGGFFEMSTGNAREILPSFLQPVEPRHGQSVLSVMAFDFHDSPVGAYGELILSIMVAPRVARGAPFPRGAFYPFLIGTTTRAAREHAIERWHLPHHMKDIELSMNDSGGEIRIAAACEGSPILQMRITEYEWTDVVHRYQAFMHDETGAYLATIMMAAQFSENEEEKGSLSLYPHEFTSAIDFDGINTTPFRELWMRSGLQTFHPLESIAAGGAPLSA